MEGHHESRHTREIPVEILQSILLRLPVKDVVRSSCVSKLWCRIVKDPAFGKLHAADHVLAPSESEALLVSENREPGIRDEASFFNLSSGVAMCHDVAIPSRYNLANICNGFLCFALDDHEQAPVLVCNPVTGETLELPKAPPLNVTVDMDLSHRFVLGFGLPTKEYKIFRLSFPRYYLKRQNTNYIAVYTLGSRRGWRQYSYPSEFCPLHTLPPPVHIDGNLYIPVETGRITTGERAARMLVLNVAAETRCMYRLPYNYYHHGYHKSWDMLAKGFELNGQMCFAVNVIDVGVNFFDEGPRGKLQFWVMNPPGELGAKDDDKLHWDVRYCFDLGDEPTITSPMGGWLDHDKILCCRHGNFLYKYDTEGNSSSNDGLLLFDQKLELPQAPPASSSPSYLASLPSCQWNICGGYRPSLLSPLTFALPPSQDEKGKKRLFEHTLLCAVRKSIIRGRIKGP